MQFSNTINHFKHTEKLAEIFSEMFGDFINLSEKRIPIPQKMDERDVSSYNDNKSVHSSLFNKGADNK